MQNSRRYTPTNSKIFTWLVRNTYGRIIRGLYNAKSPGKALAESLKPPYVLVSNHAMLLDPLMINAFVPQPIHWVASDGNMRTPIMRFLLIKLVGSIPKSKAIPDIKTVNWIVNIIRKKKGVVGFFPEGQTSWNGSNISAYGSTAKLIKLLKVPVLGVVIKGGYLSKPRWSYVRRKGRLELDFRVIFAPEELKTLTIPEIDRRLNIEITHDDPLWANSLGLRFTNPRRAEKLELALFVCPSCGKIATLHSEGTVLACRECGMSAEFGEDAHFRFSGGGLPMESWVAAGSASPEHFFDRIIDWDRWQESFLKMTLNKEMESDSPEAQPAGAVAEPFMVDYDATLLRGRRMERMKSLGKGKLSLSRETLRFEPENGEVLDFPVKKIEGAGVLKWNFFEFYVGMTVYRVRFAEKFTSGRKWAVALDILADLHREHAGRTPSFEDPS
ncbi:MAG: lysophospholipid acyltransferase family protein [Rectinemataceae bacterium]